MVTTRSKTRAQTLQRSNLPSPFDSSSSGEDSNKPHLIFAAPIEYQDIAQLGKQLQDINLDGPRPKGSSNSNSSSRYTSALWARPSSVYESVSIGFLTSLGCAILSFLGVSAAILLFRHPLLSPDIHPAAAKEVTTNPPRWVLHVPPKPSKLTGADLLALPDAYDRDIEIWKYLRHITEMSNIPSKEELIALLQSQVSHSFAIHSGLVMQYSAYSNFLYETIRDLERIKEITEGGPLDCGRSASSSYWYWSRWSEVTYAQKIFDQYREYLLSRRPAEHNENLIEGVDKTEHQNCIKINATIIIDTTDLQSGHQTLSVRKQLKILEKLSDKLQKPCSKASSKVLETSSKVWGQLNRTMSECARDALTLKRYLMPWQNYFGASREQKMRLFDAKLLEMVGMSVDRSRERLEAIM